MADNRIPLARKLRVVLVLAVLLGVSAYLVVDHLVSSKPDIPQSVSVSTPGPQSPEGPPVTTPKAAPVYQGDELVRSTAEPEEDVRVRVPLRWFSIMLEDVLPATVVRLDSGAELPATVDGGNLRVADLERDTWYSLSAEDVWFPWTEFKLADELYLRDAGSSHEQAFSALPVVGLVEVEIRLSPFTSRTYEGAELPFGSAEVPLTAHIPSSLSRSLMDMEQGFRGLRFKLWEKSVEFMHPPEDGPVRVRVPQWPLQARRLTLAGTQWVVSEFSHRSKVAQFGDVLEFKLANLLNVRVEVRDPSREAFRTHVRALLDRVNALEPEIDLPMGRTHRRTHSDLDISISIVVLENGRQAYTQGSVSKVNPDELAGLTGTVHSFTCEPSSVPTDVPVAVILRPRERGRILAYGETVFANVAHEQTVVLDAVAIDPERSVDFVFTTQRDEPVPYYQFTYELVIGDQNLVLAEGAVTCDATGTASVAQVPSVPGARLRVRRTNSHAQLVGRDGMNWVWLTEDDLNSPGPIHLLVEDDGPAQLTLRLNFPAGVEPPRAVNYLIMPKPGGVGTSTFRVGQGLLPDNVVSTMVNIAGDYLVLLTWEDAFVFVTVDYHPTRNPIFDVDTLDLVSVTLESDREMYVWPARISGLDAWSITNFSRPERIKVLSNLHLLPNRPRTIRIADPEAMLPYCHVVLNDETLARVTWEARREDGRLFLKASDVNSLPGSNLRVKIDAEALEAVTAGQYGAYIVVTATFSQGSDGVNTTGGLGKRVDITGPVTTIEGLPSGRYYVMVMRQLGQSPRGASGSEWGSVVDIVEGQPTTLTLPTR
jgi:hypothetical protein